MRRRALSIVAGPVDLLSFNPLLDGSSIEGNEAIALPLRHSYAMLDRLFDLSGFGNSRSSTHNQSKFIFTAKRLGRGIDFLFLITIPLIHEGPSSMTDTHDNYFHRFNVSVYLLIFRRIRRDFVCRKTVDKGSHWKYPIVFTRFR